MNLEISTRSAEGLLTLQGLRGVGAQIATRLASRFDTIGDITDAPEDDLLALAPSNVLHTMREQSVWTLANDEAQRELDQAGKHDVRILSCFDSNYPPLLRRIPDAPAVIYMKGQLRPGLRNVACIGTRKPSAFGTKVAQRITTHLAEKDYSVVSGLALGIDGTCHTAALDAGGHTVAILANGLDKVYPAKHRDLADRILNQGGALLSEQPFGTKAFSQHLVQRDRLQSGMSLGTFVMQTALTGGTMHTVRFTLTQERLLFVPVPTPEHAEEGQSRGIRALAEMRGQTLADALKAKDAYHTLLAHQYSSRPPAIPIHGRDDYSHVLSTLSEAASKHEQDDHSQTEEVAVSTQAPLFQDDSA